MYPGPWIHERGGITPSNESRSCNRNKREGKIHGYSAGLGLFGHSVASSNENLKALIAGSSGITGPGFFVPAKNREIVMWLLEQGFRIQWPANLMALGPYMRTDFAISSILGILIGFTTSFLSHIHFDNITVNSLN